MIISNYGVKQMKYITSIYYWCVGGLYFGFTLILIIVFSLILPPAVYDPWTKKLLRFFFKVIHTKVEVEGTENINKDNTYLFMANHVSSLDIPLLGGFIPNFFRGVEAGNHFKWPLYGWALKRYGNIAIERQNFRHSLKSIRKAENFLHNGKSIVILPEAHRTPDGKLRNFKKLPFLLAKQSGVDLVPIGLSGLFHLKRKGSWLIHPTTLKIKFGKPIPVEKINNLSTSELRDLTREKIQELIERP